MQFEFATATRIIFGEGSVKQVAPAAKQWGKRILVVTGHGPERAGLLRADLAAAGVHTSTFAVEGEPSVDLIAHGLQQARGEQCDAVIALGGGSVIDAGKAIAALLTNPGELMDYLEVVGKGQAIQNPAAPFIAVPTTAGTGSEVTRNAVLGVPARQVKVSLRSPLLLPRLAVVDPELTFGLPPAVTASTGLDALTQLIEAYVSIRANPVTDGFCVQGIPLAARSLRRAFHHGHEPEARRDMSLAALFSGLALANAGLGVVHGFAAPLGGRFPAPHGAICAAILPYGMEINLRALRARAPQSDGAAPLPGGGAHAHGAWRTPPLRTEFAGRGRFARNLKSRPSRPTGSGSRMFPTSSRKPPSQQHERESAGAHAGGIGRNSVAVDQRQ